MNKSAFAFLGLATASTFGGLAYAGGGGDGTPAASGDIKVNIREADFKSCEQAKSAEGTASGVRFTELQADMPLSCRGVEPGHFGLVIALNEPLQQGQTLQIIPVRSMFRGGSASEAESQQTFSMGMDIEVGEVVCGEGGGDTLVADLGESSGEFVAVGISVSLEADGQSTPFCDAKSCHGSYMICDGDAPVAWGSGKMATSVRPYAVFNMGDTFTIMSLEVSDEQLLEQEQE